MGMQNTWKRKCKIILPTKFIDTLGRRNLYVDDGIFR
jgi:hypothetical protein